MNTLTEYALGMMGRPRPKPPKGDAATTIAPPLPVKHGGLPLMESPAGRQSSRDFARDPWPMQMRSD